MTRVPARRPVPDRVDAGITKADRRMSKQEQQGWHGRAPEWSGCPAQAQQNEGHGPGCTCVAVQGASRAATGRPPAAAEKGHARGRFAQNQSRSRSREQRLATVVTRANRFHPWKRGLQENGEPRAKDRQSEQQPRCHPGSHHNRASDDSLTPVRACLTGEGSRQAFLQAMGDASHEAADMCRA